jgi:hypothetical protein
MQKPKASGVERTAWGQYRGALGCAGLSERGRVWGRDLLTHALSRRVATIHEAVGLGFFTLYTVQWLRL